MINMKTHKSCNDDIQDMVLGVADGTITDERMIDEVFHHLTECEYCRCLYEDYFLILQDDENDDNYKDNIFSLDLVFDNNSFITDMSNKHILQPQVHVLAQPDVPAVVIEYPYKESAIQLKIIHNKKKFDISIYYSENGVKVYLLTKNRFDVATIDNNIAYFSSIDPGSIVIFIEFKKIMKLNLKI